MDIKLFEFLDKETPDCVSEIREALDLLAGSIDITIDEISAKTANYSEKKDFKKVCELAENGEKLTKISEQIQEFIYNLDNVISEKQIEDDVKERNIPNYNDYLVDTNIEHNLYEDLTHKRPCAFKIEGKRIEIKDWKGVLIETIKYLSIKNPNILKTFVDNPKMNGRKVVYFSNTNIPTMRAPRKIDSASIYIETNLSANGIRNLLVKVLGKYNIKLNDYKIYLKADYSNLH